MTPLAETRVVVDNIQELVDALDRMGGWGSSEWIALFAALASSLFALLLWQVTRKYTTETQGIARANEQMAKSNQTIATANDRMANANDLMVKANNGMMTAAEATLNEMRHDREVMLNAPSRQAAERLQHTLAEVERAPFDSDDDLLRAQLRDAYANWAVAHVRDSEAIRDEELREDLRRFSTLFMTLAHEHESMATMAGHEGRRLAPPNLRLRWLIRALAGGLGAHRRAEPVRTALPAGEHAWAFWELPAGLDRSVWQDKMQDPEYDPAGDLEAYRRKQEERRRSRQRLTRGVDEDEATD